jgi:thiol-disulfide isomerase/thioredoxin
MIESGANRRAAACVRRGLFVGAALAMLALLPFPMPASADATRIAPDVMGKTLGGARFKLSQLRGTPVVLNFFWVNCIPCRVEMPELAELETKYKNVKFVSVHVEDEPDEQVAEFVKKLQGAPSTIVLASRRVQGNYKTFGLPETHLIDREGHIAETLQGYTEQTVSRLTQWLEEQSR